MSKELISVETKEKIVPLPLGAESELPNKETIDKKRKLDFAPIDSDSNKKRKLDSNKQFAVVVVFNYRKGVSLEVKQVLTSEKEADNYARKLAEDEFGKENVVQGVDDPCVYLYDEVNEGYTKDHGYDQNVYTVIKFNGPSL